MGARQGEQQSACARQQAPTLICPPEPISACQVQHSVAAAAVLVLAGLASLHRALATKLGSLVQF